MKRALWYAPLTLTGTALVMLRLIAAAQLLSVTEFGTLSAGLLVAGTFSVLGALGLYPLLQRDLPILLQRGRSGIGAVRLLQAMLVAALLFLLVAGAPFVGITVAGLGSAALFAALINGLAQQCFLIATLRSRSGGALLRFGWETLLRSLAIAILGLAVGWWTRSALWMLWAEAAVTVTACMLILCVHAPPAQRPAALRRLLNVGARRLRKMPWRSALTLMAGTIAGFGLANADRWVGAEILPTADFGIYAFGAILVTIAQTFQATINAAFLPWLARLHVNEPAASFRVTAITSLGLMAATLLLGMGLIPAISWFIKAYFDRYSAVLPLLPWFVAMAAARVSEFWSTWLVVTRRESTALWVQVSAVPMLGAAFYAFSRLGHDAMLTCAFIGASVALLPWCMGALFSVAAVLQRTRRA